MKLQPSYGRVLSSTNWTAGVKPREFQIRNPFKNPGLKVSSLSSKTVLVDKTAVNPNVSRMPAKHMNAEGSSCAPAAQKRN